MDELPTSWTCPKCKHKNIFTAWVFAHWHEPITATCLGCGAQFDMRRGRRGKEIKEEVDHA
jgi:transcription elongation factor Elf1